MLQTRYVDTDVIGGLGDGTSWANAYSSLNSWEAAEQVDLVAAGDEHIVYCKAASGSADTAQVIILGWTTGASNRITCEVQQADRHDGKYNTSKYRLEMSGGNPILSLEEDYTNIVGFQIKNSRTGHWQRTVNIIATYTTNDTQNKIAESIIWTTGNYTDYALAVADARVIVVIVNNLIINDSTYNNGTVLCLYGHGDQTYGKCCYYNNTCIGGIYAIDGGGANQVFKNNIGSNAVTSNFNGTFDAASDYNSSDDATSSGGANDKVSQTFTFVDSANDDFHLASGDTGAKDSGTDLSADADYAFSVDIDGDTRSGTWDIGADEFISVGAGRISRYNNLNGLGGQGQQMFNPL